MGCQWCEGPIGGQAACIKRPMSLRDGVRVAGPCEAEGMAGIVATARAICGCAYCDAPDDGQPGECPTRSRAVAADIWYKR